MRSPYYSGAGRLYRALAGRRGGVLSFHNVLPPEVLEPFDAFRMDTGRLLFEQQLDYLTRRWKIRPATEIGSSGPDGFFLSFEDGMHNNWETVGPILAKRGLTTVFAVCPGLIDGDIPHIWRDHVHLVVRGAIGGQLRLPMDGYAALTAVTIEQVDAICRRIRSHIIAKRIRDTYGLVRELCERNGLVYEPSAALPTRFSPMTWHMVRDLHAAGHVIASHSVTHRILSILTHEEKQRELGESKARLESSLGSPVRILVYPYGGPTGVDEEIDQA